MAAERVAWRAAAMAFGIALAITSVLLVACGGDSDPGLPDLGPEFRGPRTLDRDSDLLRVIYGRGESPHPEDGIVVQIRRGSRSPVAGDALATMAGREVWYTEIDRITRTFFDIGPYNYAIDMVSEVQGAPAPERIVEAFVEACHCE